MTELSKSNPENENLTEWTDVELSELKSRIMYWGEVDNILDETNFVSIQKTDYHNPEMDQFHAQQFSDNVENLSNDEIKETEKKMKDFSEVRDIIKSDYGRYLTKDFNAISGRLESKRDKVLECRGKYKEMNEPKPKFLPFLLGSLWYNSLKDKNDYLSVVDFSMDAEANRLYVINMKTNKVEVNTTCMQWQWKKWVQTFSNENGSWQSSLGLAQVPVYEKEWNARNYHRERGHKDRNLLLRWTEPWFNDNILKRYIYHTWDASKWCFTLPQNDTWHEVIDKMAYGGVIMSFYPDAKYLGETKLLS